MIGAPRAILELGDMVAHSNHLISECFI